MRNKHQKMKNSLGAVLTDVDGREVNGWFETSNKYKNTSQSTGSGLQKKYKRYEFKTFQDLEKFFLTTILPQKNIHSKVIGKVLFVWKRKKAA